MRKFLLAVRSKNDRDRATDVADAVRKENLDVQWIDEFHIHGEYDVIHVIEADGKQTAQRAATLIRTKTGNYVDLWPTVEDHDGDRIDEATRESFPASDPPSFNP